ncbi:MAG: pacearchaeosortase [archaeon]
MKKISVRSILIRYLVLIAVAIPNLWIFYFIFTPLTIYPVYLLFSVFFETSLSGVSISVSNYPIIEVVEACVAGSAYYLLLILNLSTPNIKLPKRIKMIALSFAVLLIVNILRIFSLGLLAFYSSPGFDITHAVFWYVLSTVFVVAIWFSEVKIFRIKEIPFYSDIKFLYKKSNFKK